MNRRDLIKQGPMVLLGIGSALVGVKAAMPKKETLSVVVHAGPTKDFNNAVVRAVIADVKAGGSIRELLERNTAINL